jgi:sugar phosphate isomerase/epimerase
MQMDSQSTGAGIKLAGIGDEAAVDLPGQIAAIRRLNWSVLELRTVDGTALGDLGPDAFRAVLQHLRAAELDVVCLASRIANWARPITGPFDADIQELEVLARQCEILDCRYIRIMSYPNDDLAEGHWREQVIERTALLARRAEQLGVTLLHENCAGWAGDSAERMLHLLDEVDSPALRLLFDVGNGIAHGYDAYGMLNKILPYIEHVHVKDAVMTANGPVYTIPGDGQARVVDSLRLLVGAGYRGTLSLEPHLANVPHEGRTPQGDAADRFVDAGRGLRALLDEQVLPELASDAASAVGTSR